MKKYVVIGASAASMGVLSRLRSLDADASIVCIAAQREMPYNTCLLADYIAGSKARDALFTKKADFFEEQRIDLHLETWVYDINTAKREVCARSSNAHEHVFAYDALFLGTGTAMVSPSIDGLKEYEGIFGFHTLAHADALQLYLKDHNPKEAVVIGGGLSGVECADALVSRGLHVTIIERAPQLLHSLINEDASRYLERSAQSFGVQVLTSTQVTKVCGESDKVTGVMLATGQFIPAQLVVVATGSRAQNQLAQAASLAMREGRLLVNEFMQTSDSAIYAAGDSCLVKNLATGELVPNTLWSDAIQQGMYAGMAMAGSPKAYAGVLPITGSHFFGTSFAASGSLEIMSSDEQLIIDQTENFYHAFKLRNNILVAFLMVGKLKAIGAMRVLMLNKIPVNAAKLRVIE